MNFCVDDRIKTIGLKQARGRSVTKRFFAASVAVLLPAMVLAHEGGEHFRGTVKSVSAQALTLSTANEGQITVQLDASTRFERSGTVSSWDRLVEGERVVVHAQKDASGKLTAQLVRFGAPRDGGTGHAH